MRVVEHNGNEKSAMTMIPQMQQDDEALRLLAQTYSRWYVGTRVGSVTEGVFLRIRDILYHATSQQEALAQLAQEQDRLADQESLPRIAYARASRALSRVIKAGGSIDALIVGCTDGHRHLCWPCSQDEKAVARVRFFDRKECRELLSLEIGEQRRSSYSKCQLCLQPINPLQFVILTFGGTARHGKGCGCGECNRAGTAYLLNIYVCDRSTRQVRLPLLEQVAAPSRPQGVERGIERCWQNGWYMLNKDSILP